MVKEPIRKAENEPCDQPQPTEVFVEVEQLNTHTHDKLKKSYGIVMDVRSFFFIQTQSQKLRAYNRYTFQ